MNESKIERLRQVVYSNLDPLINGSYCLLDVPAHKNIGDNLIWLGELEYLKRLPHKMVYTANSTLCNDSKVNKADVILLQGGGNFGDLWEGYQPFRRHIISRFKHKRIILFPQSVFYNDHQQMLADAKLFNEHPDLILCARDEASFGIFKQYFTANKVLLVPDMAFCLDLQNRVDNSVKNRILILKRTDKELHEHFDEAKLISSIGNKAAIDVKDWPTFDGNTTSTPQPKGFSLRGLGLTKIIANIPLLDKLVDPRYGFVFSKNSTLEEYVETGINFINQYDEVYATRLHVFILSVLLQKKVHVFDNSYGKNSGLYLAWLKDFEDVEMMNYAQPKREVSQ